MCGSSLALSAVRFFTRSASHGWYGRPPGRVTPKLMLSRPIGSSVPQFRETGSRPRGQLALPVSQMPEKSGLPSDVRGGSADKLGLPSEVVGTPAVGYRIHCPNTGRGQLKVLASTISSTVH